MNEIDKFLFPILFDQVAALDFEVLGRNLLKINES